jgi:hypothetical protein
MKKVFINNVDFSSRVEIDLSFVEKLDRELDEGYISIPHTVKKTPFNMFDIVDIYENDDILFSGRVSRDVVNVSSFNENLFNHEIHIIEHTKILERYTVKGISSTQPIDKQNFPVETLLDVTLKLRNTTPFELVELKNQFRVFNIPPETEELLDSEIAPEFNFKDLTLRQALDQIASVLDCNVRLDRNGSLFLNQFDKLKDKINFVAQEFRQELNINDYATTIESEMLNVVDVESYEENNNIVEIYPGEGSFTTLRSDDYLFNFSNSTYIPTKRPIYEVHDVKVGLNLILFKLDASGDPIPDINPIEEGFFEVSLKDRVLQKELWDTLDIERDQDSIDLISTGKFFKNNTIYYNYGRKNIFVGELFGLFEVQDSLLKLLSAASFQHFKDEGLIPSEVNNSEEADDNNNRWSVTVLETGGGSLFGNVIQNEGRLLCRTYYTPITSAITYQINRDNISEINQYSELTANQQTRIVDASRFANNLKGRVNKMGGSELSLSHRVQNYSDSFSLGDFVFDDGVFVITKKETLVHRDYYIINYELTKNFNKFSQFIGIDREIRQYETGKRDRTVERDLVYSEFIEVEAASGGSGSNASLTLANNEKVLKTLDASFNNKPIHSSLVSTTETDNFFIVGLNKSVGGNALRFNLEFEDNIIAGVRNEPDEGWWVLQKRFNEPVPYANQIARFENMTVKMYDKNFYDLAQAPVGQLGFLEDESNNAPLLLSQDLPTNPYIDASWYVAKDNREVIKFNLMYHFLSKDINEVVIGNKFVQQNGLIKTGSNNIRIWVYDNRTFDVSDKNKSLETPDQQILNPNITIDTTNSKIIVNSTINEGQSYAIVDDNGFPYIMVNSNKKHLLFHFLNKRSGIEYLGPLPVFLELSVSSIPQTNISVLDGQVEFINLLVNGVTSSDISFIESQSEPINGLTQYTPSVTMVFETDILPAELATLSANSIGTTSITFEENIIASSVLSLTSNSIYDVAMVFDTDITDPTPQLNLSSNAISSASMEFTTDITEPPNTLNLSSNPTADVSIDFTENINPTIFTVTARVNSSESNLTALSQWQLDDGVSYSESGQTTLGASSVNLKTDVPFDTDGVIQVPSSIVFNNQTFLFVRWTVNNVDQTLQEDSISFVVDSTTSLVAGYEPFGGI